MGHDPAAIIQELRKKNLANFDAWVAAHGTMIVPGSGHAIIYAGYPEGEFQRVKTILGANPQMRRMYEIVEVAHKQHHDETGCAKYDTLEVVLRRLKNPAITIYEVINASNGKSRKFADMWECANMLTNPVHGLLDKGRTGHVWDKLSEQYAKNAKGEIEIWMGSKANHKLIDQSTTMIRAELKTLLDRDDLPPSTAENVARIVTAFCEHHHKQKIFNEQQMTRALTILHTPSKH